jgi:enoyl-CoA hydratase/carnithine racemase
MSHVRRSVLDGVMSITLARPGKLNALTQPMLDDLLAAFIAAAAPQVRVVLLAGEGRSFCAGADVKESLGIEDPDRADHFLTTLARLLRTMSSLPKPVVAAVQGHAVGGGAELALEADLRVVAHDAVLGFPDVALGSTPATLYRLVRMVGEARAADMAMLGTELGASEMNRLGMVSRVVLPEGLEAAALDLAQTLRDRSGARSLRYAKEALAHASSGSRESDLAANVSAMLACYGSLEQRRYVAGFGERE